jgi:hypothetical protein
MKKLLVILMITGLIAAFVIPVLAADAQYIGAKKCMMCHKSEKRGDQWGKWSNGPHAKAFETLKSEESKAIAKKMGIDDPTTSDKCLKCHVTAHGVAAAQKAETFSIDEGVGCEACHGPGSLYKSMKVMKALTAGTQDHAEVAFKAGDEATCLTCHNEESPTYKPFDFAKRWAEIAHNIPE